MSSLKPLDLRHPLPECKVDGCENLVPTPYTGSCVQCHNRVYEAFLKAMGWGR
jgi:hypothetical protein